MWKYVKEEGGGSIVWLLSKNQLLFTFYFILFHLGSNFVENFC